MQQQLSKSTLLNYITKLVLITFFAIVFLFIAFMIPPAAEWKDGFRPGLLDLALLGFATLRLGRMFAYDLVAEPLRYPFARTVKDETGAGDSVEPRGTGITFAFGQLISCPICIGTWIAAALVYALYIIPAPTRIFITFMGVIGFAEVLNSIAEALCWSGDLSRALSGAQRIIRRKQIETEKSVETEKSKRD